MKLNKISTYQKAIIGLLISLFLYSCAHPLIQASPDQLKLYSTQELARFDYYQTRGRDQEIYNELERRRNEDINYLINNAKSLEDFEHLRYHFEEQTLASKIHDNYAGYIDGKLFDDARRKWYINKNPDISNELREIILNSKSHYDHKIILGMTKNQVIAAIGFPNDINTSKGSWGTDEQWVYGGMIGDRYFPAVYFYFSDGKLTAIQN
jgi:hypothetical protein